MAPEDLRVAGVWRLRADADGPERAPAEDFVHQYVVHERNAGAARLARKVKGPVAERLRACLDHLDAPRIGGAVALHAPAAAPLERVDMLVHQAAHAVAERHDLRGDREVHRLSSPAPSRPWPS